MRGDFGTCSNLFHALVYILHNFQLFTHQDVFPGNKCESCFLPSLLSFSLFFWESEHHRPSIIAWMQLAISRLQAIHVKNATVHLHPECILVFHVLHVTLLHSCICDWAHGQLLPSRYLQDCPWTVVRSNEKYMHVSVNLVEASGNLCLERQVVA